MKSLFSFLYIPLILTLLFISQTNAQPGGKNAPQVNIAQNALGNIVRSFIEAVNSSDTLLIKDFVHRYLSENLANTGPYTWNEKKYVTLMKNLKKQSGGLTAVDLRSGQAPEFMEVIFQPKAAQRILAVDFMKDASKDRLRFIETHAMHLPAGPYQWTTEKLSDEELARAIDKRIEKEVADDQFSGTVLIARGDSILFEKAYGYSNRGKNEKNTTDTRFHTGSIGKMLTAAAIGQLVEKGKLRFTDTLGSILKDYPNKEAAQSVTIHQLLTHTAGIADPFELGRRKEGVKYTTPGSNLPLFADAPLTMKPGSFHLYSNGNYAVLAAIVEKVSGMTFEEYINKNIFIPSGMKAADYASYTKLPRALSYSYRPDEDPLGLNPRTPAQKLENQPELDFSGFSMGYLTAKDVYRFLLALREGKLISPQMVNILTTGKVEVEKGAPVKYGYGFYDVSMWGVNMRGHSGGGSNSGIGADAEMVWKNNYYVILLGNYDLEAVRPISLSIVRFLGTK
ncbi:MAG TPA: serine hydrolase domain-containing protein [Ignavibacteriales bacterium]|nr:serine hydrolase domain-containing protein [Ignavibacteriales bacterium]